MSREEAIRAKTLELVNRTVEGERPARPKSGNGESGPLASQAEPVPAPEEPPERPSSWWEQFILGGQVILKDEATKALQLVLTELRMAIDVPGAPNRHCRTDDLLPGVRKGDWVRSWLANHDANL